MRWVKAFFALLLLASFGASALEQVRVQLRWKHQFQFAGYYVAKEYGYYRDAGLDVTLLENGPGLPGGISEVANNQVEFAVAGAGVIAAYAEGQPVVAVAAIFQHSPLVWLVLEKSGIKNLHDLAGKRLMSAFPQEQMVDLLAPFPMESIPIDTLNWVPSEFSVDALIKGHTDAYAAYKSNEPFVLRQKGIGYRLIEPRTYGVDFYGDVIITSRELAYRHPGLVEKFRDATLHGWRTALDNIDGTARLIQSKYAPQKSLEQLRFEGQQIRELVIPDMVAIGHMNQGRWERILDLNQQLGLIKDKADLSGFLFNPQANKSQWNWPATIFAFAFMGALMVLYQFRRLNKRLRLEVARRHEIEQELRSQAYTDPLTGTGNRRALMEVGHRSFAMSVRDQEPLSLIMVDVDHFKRINDSYGHDIGDLVLCHLGEVLRHTIRSDDFVGRLGGEEFAILLPGSGVESAMAMARRLKNRLSVHSFTLNPHERIAISVSAGVVARGDEDSCFEQMLSRADCLLYQAKAAGRDQIQRESTLDETPLPPSNIALIKDRQKN
ncbi:diguanylate cyclase [Gallaecimonas pentaromativorans]|uniref:diguanylate cyclase n=1 Tax=Gallaecimonas pentaromativorans TaxID=584787 RepID=UPI003A92B6BD